MQANASSVELALASILDLPDGCERQLGPEQALMLEQLEQGLRSASKGDPDDLAWLQSPSCSHIYAFQALADFFDLDAEGIRARVREHLNGGRSLNNGRVQRLGARTKVEAAA